MITRRELIEMARDPALIKGIHEACDQWCDYCPATSRCLAYRASGVTTGNAMLDPCGEGFQGVVAGMMLVKALAQAEGRSAPPEIEAMVKHGSKEHIAAALDDPLEHLGRNYMDVSEAYLASRTETLEYTWRASGPTPLEVFTWYHALAPARVFRALVCASEAASGIEARSIDALRAAKVALIGIDRSLEALGSLAQTDDDPRLQFLLTQLPRLATELEGRFPKARHFHREGLDTGGPSGRFRGLHRRYRQLLRSLVRSVRIHFAVPRFRRPCGDGSLDGSQPEAGPRGPSSAGGFAAATPKVDGGVDR